MAALMCASVVACSGHEAPPDPGPREPPGNPVLRVVEGSPLSGALEGFLPFYYDLYTFRGDGGNTRVVAAFAVPAGRLRERERRGRSRYHFDVTLVLADTTVGSVMRTDKAAFVAAYGSLRDEHLLYTQVEVQAPPSETTVQRAIMTDGSVPGIGQLYDSDYPIPDYSGDRLMLSDIALGQPGVAGGWKRGEVSLALLPTDLFPQSAFDVYYEVYNLPPDHRYTTEIAVEHLDEGREGEFHVGQVTRLRFQEEPHDRPERLLQELRRVDTSLSKGRYRLTVTITDEGTGTSASRARFFQVRGWVPGATLVPAAERGPFPGTR